jgi:hypothetical protein
LGFFWIIKNQKKYVVLEENYQIHEEVSKPIIDCIFNL